MNKKNIKSTSSVSLDNVSITYGNSVAVKNVFVILKRIKLHLLLVHQDAVNPQSSEQLTE